MNKLSDYVYVPENDADHFALTITQELWGIPEGALLICQVQGEIEENKIMVLKVVEALILVKFKRVGELYIMNASTTAEPKVLTEQQFNEILSASIVLGKAINYSVEC